VALVARAVLVAAAVVLRVVLLVPAETAVPVHCFFSIKG
jgi:hypothetical protein